MAVVPPPALIERLRAMERPVRPGVRWTTPQQWHVTLRFFAAVAPDSLVSALGALVAPDPPTVAVCGPAPTGLSRHVWALPVAGLDGLAAAVATATADLAPPITERSSSERPFRGHLTLARGGRRGSVSGLPAPPTSFEWQVDEVVAVMSELGRNGPRYSTLARYGLERRPR